MTTAKDKSEHPQEAWTRWMREHEEVLTKATAPQRVLLEAAVRFLAAVCAQPLLLRLTAFFLLHAGLGLTPVQVGAAVRRTDRAMRTVQALSAHAMLESLWGEFGRHRQPKLHAEHAGPIAKYLVEHPGCPPSEVVAFIESDLKIAIDVQTLRRFFNAYGLGVLRPERGGVNETEDERPFCLGAPSTGAPFSCSRLHLR